MRYLGLTLLLLVLVSCDNKKPKSVLPADKMQAVISDLYLAEAYSTQVNDSAHKVRNRNVDSLAVFYKTILVHHNISRESLEESIDWYKRNPEELDSVYAKVIPELGKLQATYPVK